MEDENRPINPTQKEREGNDPLTHKISMQINFADGNAITTVQPDSVFSSQQQNIILNVINVLKTTMQDFGSELVPQIKAAVSSSEYVQLFDILGDNKRMGKLHYASSKTINQIFDLIRSVPIDSLTLHQAKLLIDCKLFCSGRLGIFKGLYNDISFYLRTFQSEINENLKQSLILAQANCAAQERKNELAYSIYNSVIKTAQDGTTLAWAHRGLANILDPSDPDSLYHENLAGDLFLQSGHIENYVGSKVRCADKVEFSDPEAAIKMLDAALQVCDPSDDSFKKHIISIQLKKSKIYDRMGSNSYALEEAQSSLNVLNLQRSYGLESLQISAYSLIIFLAEKQDSVDPDLIQDAQDNIFSLEQRLQNDERSDYEIRKKLMESLNKSDADTLHGLSKEIDALQDQTLKVLYLIVDILVSAHTFFEKMERLEELYNYIKNDTTSLEVVFVVYNLYADIYLDHGDYEKAIMWYRKALDINPFLWHCRQNYLALLCKTGKWNDAASYLETQVKRFGDQPNLLFVYGRALIEVKSYGKAIKVLRKAQKMLPDSKDIGKLLSFAIDSCSDEVFTIDQNGEASTEPLSPAITLESFRALLTRFSEFIRSEVRMSFWKSAPNRKHVWVASPEKYGQTLLHTFIKSKYSDAVEVMEEVGTGAGRIDVYIQFSNGFKTIIELKMCGHSYSEAYSLEGTKQLEHYLVNKKLHVGYLLIFDSRTRDFGENIQPVYSAGRNIIYTNIVDVRPSIK